MGLIIDTKEGESVYDPACGTGGMLMECVNHLREVKKDYRTLKMYGQEKNLTTSTVPHEYVFAWY
jgi:type I restriction enzyme M protein